MQPPLGEKKTSAGKDEGVTVVRVEGQVTVLVVVVTDVSVVVVR